MKCQKYNILLELFLNNFTYLLVFKCIHNIKATLCYIFKNDQYLQNYKSINIKLLTMNAAQFNTIKLISIGDDNYVKKRIINIVAF